MEPNYVYSVMETRDWDGDPAYVRGVRRTLDGVLEEVKQAIVNRSGGDTESVSEDFSDATRSLKEWWPGPTTEARIDRRSDEWTFQGNGWESDHEVVVTRHKLQD